MKHQRGEVGLGSVVFMATVVVVGIVLFCMFAVPTWNVWRKGLSGEAQLREAEWNRQIAVKEAQAFKESASFKAEAEVIRARGVDEANKIIQQGLGGPEGYLDYLSIQALEHVASSPNGSQVIYVPAQGIIPITEANRLKRVQ